jgi:small-conductance mechanosensitive channel
MRLRRLGYGALMVVGILVSAVPAWSAQQPAPARPQTSPQPVNPAPAAISVMDVIPRSEGALAQLQDIRTELEADKSVGVVEAELTGFSDQLDQWWKGEAGTIQQLRSLQRMNDVLWQLRLYEGQISTWNALLAASSKKLSVQTQVMDNLVANWKATQLALDTSAPEGVTNKIAEVLKVGDAVQRLFQEKTARLVSAQGRLAASLNRVSEIRAEVDSVNMQPAVNLLSLTSAPMWKALFRPEPATSASAQIGDGLSKLYNDAKRILQLYRDHLFLHVLLFVLLLAEFFRLRQLSHKPSTVTPTDAERFILDRSFSSALLVSLFLTPILYSEASPQMVRLILFPVVVPLLTLLPAVFVPHLRRALYLLTVVYTMDFCRYYLPPQGNMVRLLLFAEALLGIAAIHLLQKSKLFESEALKSREASIRTMLKIGTGLFLGAIIANLVGALNLAEVLFSPLVRTLYIGVVIRMMTVVATTFAVMAVRSPVALMLRTVQEDGETVVANIRKGANFIAVSLWILIGLFNFGLLGYLENTIEEIFDAKWHLGAIEISVHEVVTFLLVFGVAYALSRTLRFILTREIFPRFHMPRGVPDVLDLLARYGVLLFGFLLAMVSAGVNLSQMTIALSAFGVGIGFGLQNIVNNFVCGLILVFEHPIQVGDSIEVGPHAGRVERIGFRSSSVSTGDGGTVIIPNSELIGSKVVNWSLVGQMRRITLRVPVPIDTDPKTVIDMFQEIARRNQEVEPYPAPTAALDKFADGSLMFILRCWTRIERTEAVGQSLTLAINKAFREAGIQIPFAQSDVHLHWQQESASEIKSVERANPKKNGEGVPPKTIAAS